MKNLNNLIYLTKKANLTPSANSGKEDDSIFTLKLPQLKDYSAELKHPQSYTQGESLEQASPTHIVDTEPVWDIDAKSRQVVPEKQPNITLNRQILDSLNPTDLTQPITLAKDPNDYFKKYVMPLTTTPDVPDTPEEQAWYDKLAKWIKENPWTAGAGALGLGGLGYYLLSDDDEEEEEEEE